MMFKSKSLHVAIATASLSFAVQANENMEEVVAVGQKISFSNSSTTETMKHSKSSMNNVMDMINDLPGVNIAQGDAFGSDDYTTSINMRGFSISADDSQLGITVDGIPNGGSAYGGGSKANRYLDSENTSNINVAQGSADIASASLEALGGTLDFVSDNPDYETNTRLDYTTGDHNARKIFMRQDTGQVGNSRAYFSVSQSENNRWIGTGSNGHSNRLHFEAKSVTELDDSRISARVSYDDTHEDNYNTISLADFKQNANSDGLTSFWTGDPDIDQYFAEAWSTLRQNTLLSVKGEFNLTPAISLDVTPYFHKQTGRGDWLPPYQTTSGGVTYNWVDANGDPVLNPTNTDNLTRVSSYRHTHYDKDRYGTTVNLAWQLGIHNLRAGFWYEDQQRNEIRDWHAVLNPTVSYQFDRTPYLTQFNRDYTTQVLKYYVQDNMYIGDATITLGAQQYLVDVDYESNFDSSENKSINSDSDVLPSVGFIYNLNHNLELFAGYAENFKAIQDATLEASNEQVAFVDPETATNTEIGLRYFGTDITLNATAYNVDFDNRVTQLSYDTTDAGTPDYLASQDGRYVNLGGLDSQGLELAMEWNMTPSLTLTTSVSLNESTYSDNVQDENSDYRKGDKVAGIPETTGYLALAYNNQGYRAGISSNWTNSYYGAANGGNTDKIPAYMLTNAYVGRQYDLGEGGLKNLDIGFVINNLTDTNYIAGGQEGAYILGASRTAAITASINF
ncbi:TonB-dependent receptor domain-containing protein [Bermanella sp. R86510]|uniref:TonB-dependent receptor domain-containing protein n=1 Tax=unclassified Bermanella TaxID=2627862 RepID=UPI0037C925F3